LLQPTSAILVAKAQAVRAGAQSFADVIVPPHLDFYLKINYFCLTDYDETIAKAERSK
jgi:hypothetical protein